MSWGCGSFCTVLVGLEMWILYRKCSAVYHKFKSGHGEEKWVDGGNTPVPRGGWNKVDKPKNSKKRGWFNFGSKNQFRKNSKDKGRSSLSGHFVHRNTMDIEKTKENVLKSLQAPEAPSMIHQEGYMSIRYGKISWKRRYFVLYGYGLYFYKDERSFQKKPQKPVLSRPLDMNGYIIVGISMEPPWRITLRTTDPDDIRGAVELACDTLEEMNIWSEALQFVVENSSGAELTYDDWNTIN